MFRYELNTEFQRETYKNVYTYGKKNENLQGVAGKLTKIVRILILTLLLAGCTSSQLRSMSRSLGIHKVARVFPVDLSSREKQVFRVRNLEKPSF